MVYDKGDLKYILNESFNKRNCGITFLDNTTGAGKTYHSILFTENTIKEQEKTRFFFCVNTKINIPDREIEKYPDLKKKHQRLFSFADAVEDFLKEKKSFKNLVFTKEFNKVLSRLEEDDEDNKNKKNIKEFKKYVEQFDKRIISYGKLLKNKESEYFQMERDRLLEVSSNLKKYLKRILKALYKDEETIITNVLNEDIWEFVRIFYSGVYLYDVNKQFFTLTVDKWINPIDTIVGKCDCFYTAPDFLLNDSYLKNFFDKYNFYVDEIDAAFKTIASAKYEKAAQESISIPKLVSNLCNSTNRIYSSTFMSKDLEEPYNQFKNEVEDFLKKYPHFHNASFKFRGDVSLYVCRDYGPHVYSQKDSFIYVVKFDKSENRYVVSEKEIDEKLDDEEYLLIDLLNDLSSFIDKSVIFINKATYIYLNNTNKDIEALASTGISCEKMTKDQALSSVLENMHIIGDVENIFENVYFKFFKYRIESSKKHRNIQSVSESNEVFSYFNTGFELFNVNQSNFKFENDDIRCVFYASSIENDFINIANKVNIVCMSATCRFDTSIDNLDLEYLKTNLKEKYYEPSDDVKSEIRKSYKERNNYDFEGIKVIVDFPDILDVDRLKKFNIVFPDIKSLKNKFEELGIDSDFIINLKDKFLKYSDDESEYYPTELVKNILSIKNFLNKGLKQILSLSTAGYCGNTYEEKRRLIKEFLAVIFVELELIKNKEDFNRFLKEAEGNVIFFTNSENIKKQQEDIEFRKKASLGNRIIVFSSYQSIGAGQNLQFIIPFNDIKTVKALNAEKRKELNNILEKIKSGELTEEKYEKLINSEWVGGNPPINENLLTVDFPAIYLSIPTNIIPNIKEGFPFGSETMIEQIDKIKRMTADGSLSQKDEVKFIRKIITNKGGFLSYNDKHSVMFTQMKTVVQGGGRAQRCSVKYPENVFYFDKRLLFEYDWEDIFYDLSQNILVDKIQEFLKKARSSKTAEVKKIKKDKEERKKLKKIEKNRKAETGILYLVKSFWKADSSKQDIALAIEQYQELNNFILHNPTCIEVPILKYISKIDGIEKRINLLDEGYYWDFESDINHYFYKKEKNNIVNIETTKPIASGYQQCSLMDIGSRSYFDCKEIVELFDKNGLKYDEYQWIKGRYIISPATYINLYKGRIGEMITRAIFENVFDQELEELSDDCFELFDFKIKDKDIYIDAKLHQPEFFKDNVMDSLNDKEILNKLKVVSKTGKSKVIILNVSQEMSKEKDIITTDGIFKIPNIFGKNFNHNKISDIISKDIKEKIEKELK